jgi:hypothetical protein
VSLSLNIKTHTYIYKSISRLKHGLISFTAPLSTSTIIEEPNNNVAYKKCLVIKVFQIVSISIQPFIHILYVL